MTQGTIAAEQPLFDDVIKFAEQLGYEPNVKTITWWALMKVANVPDDPAADNHFFNQFKLALVEHPECGAEYGQVSERMENYLQWAVPYLFLDDYEGADIQRDPQREKYLAAELKQLLIDLQL